MAQLEAWMTDFLTEIPAHTAVLATVRPDGRAHTKPLWVALDGDTTVVLITGEETVAGRNLTRDPWARLCVEVETPPYSFLNLEGPVTLTTYAEDPGALRLWAGRIGARYLGSEAEEQLAELNGGPGKCLVRMTIRQANGAYDIG